MAYEPFQQPPCQRLAITRTGNEEEILFVVLLCNKIVQSGGIHAAKLAGAVNIQSLPGLRRRCGEP